MSQSDTGERTESSGATEGATAERGRGIVSTAAPYLRRGVESGAAAALVGGTGLVGGLRALLAGERRRGLAGLVLGAAFLGAAAVQQRSRGRKGESDVEEIDVVGTGPDVEAVADEAGGVGEDDHAGGEAAAAVADTTPDVEDADPEPRSESGPDAESASVDGSDVADAGVDSEDLAAATERETGGGDATESETEAEAVDRLGEAAFDRQSREVPVPQRAFNQGFLSHSAEAFWGVRADDDAVLVSGDYDAVEGGDGVRYVASSEIGGDVRELPIPDTVLDHWDDVYGGGTAVTGGDGILFATTDDLAADGLLRVLPADWADDAFGEGE